jgi:hypothetical protein
VIRLVRRPIYRTKLACQHAHGKIFENRTEAREEREGSMRKAAAALLH